MNTHEKINEMLAGYVLGELSDRQSSEVEAHLTKCQDCTSQAQRLKSVLKSTSQMGELSADKQTCESAKKVLFETIVTDQIKEPTPRPTVSLEFLWRTIMNSRMTKLAAAVVIVVAIWFGATLVGGPDLAKTAWADVTSRVAQVDYVHFLFTPEPRYHRTVRPYEGWYSHGKVVTRSWLGNVTYDDGQTCQGFDRHNIGGPKAPSEMKGRTFFAWISKGLLAEDNEQFSKQVPASVGDDFLVYEFDPPDKDTGVVERISVTVGRYSLLPVQVKTWHKYDADTGEGMDDIKDGYTLFIFDYAGPDKPAEFFEPPTVSEPPHGRGEVVLNGEEVMIQLSRAPGIKTLVMRLYSESFESSADPVLLADVAFILDDGLRSITCERVQVGPNGPNRIGMGSVDNWPDRKYRNISSTLILKPTDKENTFAVEISCWLDTIREGDI